MPNPHSDKTQEEAIRFFRESRYAHQEYCDVGTLARLHEAETRYKQVRSSEPANTQQEELFNAIGPDGI